jgi:hypothetical protein
MNFCGECGAAFGESQKFCGSCGSRRESLAPKTRESPLARLGIHIPPPKIRVSETLGWENFAITDYVTEQDLSQFRKAWAQLVKLEKQGGFGSVDDAWLEMAEAGYSAAWTLLSDEANRTGDYESATKYFRLATHCAWNDFDDLIAGVTQGENLGRRLQEALGVTEGQLFLDLAAETAEALNLVRTVTQAVYADGEILSSWLKEDEADTRRWLSRAGFVMNIYQFCDLSGKIKHYGFPGGFAWGLLLRLEFGAVEQQAEAERALRQLASVDTRNSVALSNYEPIQQRMVELGLAWWKE